MVFSRGLPEPCSLPTSWCHRLISRTSATARANRALCLSKFVSSSPLSRPSVPSRSSTRVVSSLSLGETASQMPWVVWDLPELASISRNEVPKT